MKKVATLQPLPAGHAPALAKKDPGPGGNSNGHGRRSRLRPPTVFFFGTRIDNIRRETALHITQEFAAHPAGLPARQVFFTNVHSIYLARKDRDFMRVLNRADLILPDGSGLQFAGRMFGTPILENLNGTDFTPQLLQLAQTEGWSVYLVGGKPDIIRLCRDRLSALFPGLIIAGCRHGYFSPKEEQTLIDDINRTRPNLLLVALGSPMQEKWIARSAPQLHVGVCLAVGGLFDFLSGVRRRAPQWMRRVGMEWLFRLLQDPKTKWNRVLIEIPWFILRVLAKRFLPQQVRLLHQKVAS